MSSIVYMMRLAVASVWRIDTIIVGFLVESLISNSFVALSAYWRTKSSTWLRSSQLLGKSLVAVGARLLVRESYDDLVTGFFVGASSLMRMAAKMRAKPQIIWKVRRSPYRMTEQMTPKTDSSDRMSAPWAAGT